MPPALGLHALHPVIAGVVIAALVAASGCDHDAAERGPRSDAEEGPVIADADTVRRRVIGHTVSGHMGAGTTREFFARDGSIHGAGYRAEWDINGDRLCLNYDESPQQDCYRIRLEDDRVQWLRNGEVQGEGCVVAGNPDNL